MDTRSRAVLALVWHDDGGRGAALRPLQPSSPDLDSGIHSVAVPQADAVQFLHLSGMTVESFFSFQHQYRRMVSHRRFGSTVLPEGQDGGRSGLAGNAKERWEVARFHARPVSVSL